MSTETFYVDINEAAGILKCHPREARRRLADVKPLTLPTGPKRRPTFKWPRAAVKHIARERQDNPPEFKRNVGPKLNSVSKLKGTK